MIDTWNSESMMDKLLQEMESALEDERRATDEARQVALILERKRLTIQAEFEDLRTTLDTVRSFIRSFVFV